MKNFFGILLMIGTVLQGSAEENQEMCALGLKTIQGMLSHKNTQEEEKETCGTGPRSMRADIRHIESGGIGYQHGYTTLEIFLASDPNQWCVTPFLDVRGHMFNNGKRAVNIGIGGRTNWGCRAYGMNVYYDYRNTSRRTYNQVGVGLETLGKLWDLRVNGYFPVGEKVSLPYNVAFGGFSGNSVLVDRKFQYAMTGVDGEAGFHFGKTHSFDFYTAAGPYYFKGHMGKGAVGGKARIAGYYKEYVTLEFSDSWDTVFHNKFQGQLTLSLPFGPRSQPKPTRSRCPDTCDFANILTARMLQPVARQEIIVAGTHTKTNAASNHFLFVNNLSSSAGTFESPFATLVAAQNASVPGDIIYVFPGNGTTTGMSNGITLKGSQKFWGSGVGHSLATNLGTIFIPNLTSTSPQMTNTGGHAIVLANNNEISGFTISNWTTGNGGISATSLVENIEILSCTISSTIANVQGILADVAEVHNLVIDDVVVNCSHSSSSGILMGVSGNCALSNSTVSGGAGGVFFYPDITIAANIKIDSNTIGKTAVGGIDTAGLWIQQQGPGATVPVFATIQNNTISSVDNANPACQLYAQTGSSACVYLTGNSSHTTGGNGYSIGDGIGTMYLSPCGFASVNSGTFTGTNTPVNSCSSLSACPP